MGTNSHIRKQEEETFLKNTLQVITAFMCIILCSDFNLLLGKLIIIILFILILGAYLKILLRLLFIFSNRRKPFK